MDIKNNDEALQHLLFSETTNSADSDTSSLTDAELKAIEDYLETVEFGDEHIVEGDDEQSRLPAGAQQGKLTIPTLGLDRGLEKKLHMLADTGSVRALSALGRYYFQEKRFTKALSILKRCPLWDLHAHYRIGIMYFEGLETKKDLKRGIKHIKDVATATVESCGVPEALIRSAQYFLGYAYYGGFGVLTNEDEAIKWWLLAANEGKPSGSVLAQSALGLYYSDPWHFDVHKAARWHKLADENNNPASKTPYAVMCINGLGTAKDPMKALKLLKEAAVDKNNVFAAGNLIAFYYHRKMFNLAAQVADRVVSSRMFSMDEHAIRNQADRKGLALTSFYLGRCYQLGHGVEKHIPTAHQLYKKAITLDYVMMYKLYQDMIQDVA